MLKGDEKALRGDAVALNGDGGVLKITILKRCTLNCDEKTLKSGGKVLKKT